MTPIFCPNNLRSDAFAQRQSLRFHFISKLGDSELDAFAQRQSLQFRFIAILNPSLYLLFYVFPLTYVSRSWAMQLYASSLGDVFTVQLYGISWSQERRIRNLDVHTTEHIDQIGRQTVMDNWHARMGFLHPSKKLVQEMICLEGFLCLSRSALQRLVTIRNQIARDVFLVFPPRWLGGTKKKKPGAEEDTTRLNKSLPIFDHTEFDDVALISRQIEIGVVVDPTLVTGPTDPAYVFCNFSITLDTTMESCPLPAGARGHPMAHKAIAAESERVLASRKILAAMRRAHPSMASRFPGLGLEFDWSFRADSQVTDPPDTRERRRLHARFTSHRENYYRVSRAVR